MDNEHLSSQLTELIAAIDGDIEKLKQLSMLNMFNEKHQAVFKQLKEIKIWVEQIKPEYGQIENLRKYLVKNAAGVRNITNGYSLVLDRFDKIFGINEHGFTQKLASTAARQVQEGADVSEVAARYNLPVATVKNLCRANTLKSLKIPEAQKEWASKNRKKYQHQFGESWKPALAYAANKRNYASTELTEVLRLTSLNADAMIKGTFSLLLKLMFNFEMRDGILKNITLKNSGDLVSTEGYYFLELEGNVKINVAFTKDRLFSAVRKLMIIARNIDEYEFSPDAPYQSFVEKVGSKELLLIAKEMIAGYLSVIPSRVHPAANEVVGVWVSEQDRKTGLSVKLYKHVLKTGKPILSDSALSDGGLSIWKRLTADPGLSVYAFPENNPGDIAEVYINGQGQFEYEPLTDMPDSIFSSDTNVIQTKQDLETDNNIRLLVQNTANF